MKGLIIRDAQMDAFRQSLARALHLRLAASVRSACADETASWSDPMLLAVIADEVTRAREHDIIDEIDCLHYLEFLFRHGARGVTPAMPAVPAWAAESSPGVTCPAIAGWPSSTTICAPAARVRSRERPRTVHRR